MAGLVGFFLLFVLRFFEAGEHAAQVMASSHQNNERDDGERGSCYDEIQDPEPIPSLHCFPFEPDDTSPTPVPQAALLAGSDQFAVGPVFPIRPPLSPLLDEEGKREARGGGHGYPKLAT